MQIGIKSLGCPKNFVDTEVICGKLREKGYQISEKIDNSDIVIINTCGFIRDAVEESIEEILNLIKLKKEGKIKHIIVTGCLPQRYKDDNLNQEFPEVDAFLGVGDLLKIDIVIKSVLQGEQIFKVSPEPKFLYNHNTPRTILTPQHYAYIKISEGCQNNCSYCLIPQIRGNHRSRKMEDIIEEVKIISAKQNLSEIILIGQDTTLYGIDLYGEYKLAELLKKLSLLELNNLKWIRFLYTHPAHYNDELIEVIANYPKICPYLDLPLQHISDKILKRMNRPIKKRYVISLINKLRDRISNLTLRTTFMVGFPGETDKDFEELLNFVKEFRFERLGTFIFSREEGTPAYDFPQQIPMRIKKERLKKLMLTQQLISKEINSSYMGKEIEVLIDEIKSGKPKIAIGRTKGDAPEIDGKVIIRGDKTKVGRFIKVKVTEASEYDLTGEIRK
ncbi:30S ribosomal protein S12 methylthiotransferase RimO [bacterium]|nr:30S ribosomal protein S12 methylthiotransferase RimO [bacterium]MBU4603033.1 30S ribosomal protein S12 methylthiotransferase RimO [bacterium]MCG2762673.1 30S ribosomal protein S12 methylthiotransferase RimO [Candidatus Atribacteria bacterium]